MQASNYSGVEGEENIRRKSAGFFIHLLYNGDMKADLVVL